MADYDTLHAEIVVPPHRFILPGFGELTAGRARWPSVLAFVRSQAPMLAGKLTPAEYARLCGVSQQRVSEWVGESGITAEDRRPDGAKRLQGVYFQENGRAWIPVAEQATQTPTGARFARPQLRVARVSDFCLQVASNAYSVFKGDAEIRAYYSEAVRLLKGTRVPEREIAIPAFKTLAHDGLDDVLFPVPETDAERNVRLRIVAPQH